MKSSFQLYNSISYHSRNKIVILHLKLLKAIYKRRPVPLPYWLKFHSLMKLLFSFSNHISPPHTFFLSTGESLKIPELKKLLKVDVLGDWALDRSVIQFLWDQLLFDRPKVIIECGAGISSLILAKYAQLYGQFSKESLFIFSFEQDLHTKKKIESRLKKSGLGDYVQITHTPISDQGRYKIDSTKLNEQIGGKKADWLLIDGPSGPAGCRIWTIPILAQFCRSGAIWFLDDAFRNGELQVLRQWMHWPGVMVKGIYPMGKGLGVGIIQDPQRLSKVK